MNFDISQILEQWDYQPGQAAVRKFTGKDGVEKIQLRVDLGILQMNAEGRPDGKRPLGHASLYDYYRAKLAKYLAANGGSDAGFQLKAEDCGKLQLEAFQFHNRYNCLLQLKEFAAVTRDTERNLAVFEFVKKYAATEELAWTLQQFKPQLLMIHVQARANQFLAGNDHAKTVQQIEEGIEQIREFYKEHGRNETLEHTGEVGYLKNWLEEIYAQRPLTEREKLERALHEAITNEDYEKAAQMRDALRNLKPTE
jgi:hypothetical protein